MPDVGPGGPIDAGAKPTATPVELMGAGNAKPFDNGKVRSPAAMSDGDRSLARGSMLRASISDPDSPAAGSRA